MPSWSSAFPGVSRNRGSDPGTAELQLGIPEPRFLTAVRDFPVSVTVMAATSLLAACVGASFRARPPMSNLFRERLGDREITGLEAAGLPLPCIVRLKLFTLDNRLIRRRIGQLSEADHSRMRRSLDTYIR